LLLLKPGGKRAKAERITVDMRKLPFTPAAWIAMVYSGLGSKRDAMAWLKPGYKEHNPLLVLLNREPSYDTVHSDRTFRELLRNVGPS